MLTKLSIVFTLILASAAAAHYSGAMPEQQAKSGERVPVIVELFTSEGCSSCPPADEALRRLASTQPVPGVEIVAMSEHVDYWNSLGWTDPFSSAQFSQRQDEYGRAFRLDGSYTPQMVVDGREQFVGNDVRNAVQAISRAATAAKRPVQVTATKVNADSVRLQVQIQPDPAGGSDDVYLAVTEDNLSSDVKRGENEGRVIAHTSVVRRLSLIGNADRRDGFHGEPVIRLDRRWKASELRFLIFVQDHKSRRILAAQAARAQQ
jgi:hypothetical protein